MRVRALEIVLGLTVLFGAASAGCQGTVVAAADGDGGTKAMGPSCASCHMADYLQVRTPPHEGVKPTACAVCHTQTGWHPSVLDHPWPLTGKHEKTDCFLCHKDKPPVFKGTKKACYACHAAEYDKPPFADHMLFQKACEECHTTTDWKTLVPHPIWPPEPAKEEDAGAQHDAGHAEPHDAGAGVKPKPKPPPPKPTGSPTTPPTGKPPDVTTGGSRHGR